MMELTRLIDIPDGYLESGQTICSNFDHTIDNEVVELCTSSNVYAEYPGWNFFAYVWFDKRDKQWYGKIMQFGSHVATFSADTMDELRREISNNYGYD